MRVWELSTGLEVVKLDLDSRTGADSVTFSPDSQHLAIGCKDGTARVWEVSTRKQVAKMVHGSRVITVAFSPDGLYLGTGSQDCTARIWNWASGEEMIRMTHRDNVNAIAFSPDGNLFVSGSQLSETYAKIWRLWPSDLETEACTRLSRNLTVEEWRKHMGDLPYRKTCPDL